MDHHLRMMYIYLCLRKCLKDFLADCRINLHRSHRIILSRTSCIDLKCEILVRISSIYMRDHVSCQLIKSLILY